MSDTQAILETGSLAAVELAATALAKSGKPPKKCPNCGHSMIGHYCAICGQPGDTHRRSILALVHDFFQDIVNVDSRILRTIVALLVEPGELPRAFREGRTQRYLPALRLYLFVSLLFFVILSAANIAFVQIELVNVTNAYVVKMLPGNKITIVARGKASAPIAALPSNAELAPGVHAGLGAHTQFFAPIGAYHKPAGAAARVQAKAIENDVSDLFGKKPSGLAGNVVATFRKLVIDPTAFNAPLTAWIPRALFLLMPLFALLLALFYVRQRKSFYFVDHLVFSFTVHTFLFVVLIAAVGAAQFLPGVAVAWGVLAALALYLLIAMKRFYAQGWAITAVKFVAIGFVYLIFFLFPALLGVVLLSLMEG